MADAGAGGAPLAVLVVCTANICRSPAAETLLRARLAAPGDVAVTSAGLAARVGSPMAAEMAGALDLPVTGFRARQVTPDMVGRSDLVLTMTREQRAALVDLVPAAIRRTFTLTEYAALITLAADRGQVAGSSIRQRLVSATAQAPRFRSARTAGPQDDIVDPYGRSRAHFQRAAEELEQAVAAVVAAVGAAAPAAGAPSALSSSSPHR